MTKVSIEEAQGRLAELIQQLGLGDEVVITENDQPVAKLVRELPRAISQICRTPVAGKGYMTIFSDDDEQLKDFEEYMP